MWHRRFENLHCTSLPGLQNIVSRDTIFQEKVVFRQTQELSKEDEVPPLEFLVQNFKGRKRNLRIKFQMFLRTLKIHQKNYLKFLLPKGDQLGIKKWYKKARSMKLLSGPSEKYHIK